MNAAGATLGRCASVCAATAFGAAALGWALSGLSAVPADARNSPCSARVFNTDLVKDACARGGQAAAKKIMKQFMAEAQLRLRKVGLKGVRELTCDSCHTRLAPDYPLTNGGLALFKRLGG